MKNILISIKNIKKYFGNKKALDDVSLDIYEGEILGLLGVNGAGKTTLSSIIATINPPTSGDIFFQGKSIYKNINFYRNHISLCPQRPNLIQDLTVRQNIEFNGRFFGMSERDIKIGTDSLIKKYQLEEYQHQEPAVLSGGYNQRVMIARALIHKPKLVILDEPTVGLDPHIRQKLWETIRNLKQQGISVILTTHYLDEAEFLTDRICILDKGKIKLIDTTENLKKSYQNNKLEDIFIKLMKEETI